MRAFHELTNAVDDLVDEHVGDKGMILHYAGRQIPVVGTVRTEQDEQFVDGLITPITRFYVSLAERKLPYNLSGGSYAHLTRCDPYNPDRTETFSIVAVDRPRSGRVKIILSLFKGEIPSRVAERVPDARKNTATTPYR